MSQLILLPGALGHAEQFKNLITELESYTINAIALDLPGHGINPYSPEAISVPLMAEALLHKFDEQGITEPVTIFGHSLGGYIGLYMCMHFPKRVNSLFTMGTKWHWTEEISKRETSMLNPEKMEEKIPKFVEHLKSVHQQDWKRVVNTIAFLMNDLGQNQYLEPQNLGEINKPVRIGLGDRDAMVSLDETVNVYSALPNGQLQIYPSTPHPYEKMNTQKLALDLKQFLEIK